MSRVGQVAERLAPHGGILLREKDLSEEEYWTLAEQVKHITEKHSIPLIVHSYPQVACELHTPLHLPMPLLEQYRDMLPEVWGVSVHSVQEAVHAQERGASYVIAGHIFSTDCKKGIPPRGLEFLRKVTASVTIPVYAIGGVTVENSGHVFQAGAAGACMMSSWMAQPIDRLPLP